MKKVMKSNGEYELMQNYPFYKRRYGVSGDMFIGCRYACDFCYYRFIDNMKQYYQKNSNLKQLCTPIQFANVIERSKMINYKDIFIMAARSDLSMPEHRNAFYDFMDIYNDTVTKDIKFILLQRGIYKENHVKRLCDYDNVIFGTTITPSETFTNVKHDKQLHALFNIRKYVPGNRISIEIRPLYPGNMDNAIEVIKYLKYYNLVDFVTIGGVSIGQYGDYKKEIEKLKRNGFLPSNFTGEKSYFYNNGKKEVAHDYYILKNYLPESIEYDIMELASNDFRIYRKTDALYPLEFDIPVAFSRNNKINKRLIKALSGTKYQIKDYAAEVLKSSINVVYNLNINNIERLDYGIFRIDTRLTEDMAHTIGANYRVALLSSDFSNQPTLQDIEFYKSLNFITYGK